MCSTRFKDKKKWWTGWDLNPRPSGCKPDDATRLIYRPIASRSLCIDLLALTLIKVLTSDF